MGDERATCQYWVYHLSFDLKLLEVTLKRKFNVSFVCELSPYSLSSLVQLHCAAVGHHVPVLARLDPADDVGGAQPAGLRGARRRHLPHAAGAHRDLHYQVRPSRVLLCGRPCRFKKYTLVTD